jgi:hypothetical protein
MIQARVNSNARGGREFVATKIAKVDYGEAAKFFAGEITRILEGSKQNGSKVRQPGGEVIHAQFHFTTKLSNENENSSGSLFVIALANSIADAVYNLLTTLHGDATETFAASIAGIW